MPFSAVRVNKIRSVAQLRGATLHAERADSLGQARIRDGAEAGLALAWSKAATDRDYLGAFRAHKAELKAGERKNAPLAMQALCVVSPDWVQAAGDLHDPQNPRNQALFAAARAWAESWAGKGAVFGVRLDLDEVGGAVVDLMIAPVRESRGKPVISTQKALVELKAATGERNEYAALQTSWAGWCQEHLDHEIQRGIRREITAREHVSPETYGAIRDEAILGLQGPSHGLWEAMQKAELSRGQASALADYATLKGEIHAHKRDPHGYEPPAGSLDPEEVAVHLGLGDGNPWPTIKALRSGADRLMEIATRFGASFHEVQADRSYQVGRKHFPSLKDRMHLAAVVARCGELYAWAEAYVKNTLSQLNGHEAGLEVNGMAPFGAEDEVERHELALGLRTREEADREREEQERSARDRRSTPDLDDEWQL